MKSVDSGMGNHWIGQTLDEMLAPGGMLFKVNAGWLEELAKKNLWSQAELRSHRWTESDLLHLPAGVEQRVGCVRNITYADCKSEAGRLYKLGKLHRDDPYVDSFDYLWGQHKPTDEYLAHLVANNGSGAGWTGGKKFEGVTHAETVNFPVLDFSYAELPEDLESSCCLFKTPPGTAMRGAAFNDRGKDLWKRKCTVCLA